MTAPLVRRTTLRGLWDALKRSSPLYTAFRRLTKVQALLLLLLILGECVVLGALVASDRAIRGDTLGTPPAIGAALLGEGRGQGASARQQPAGVRFVSSWGLSDTRSLPATADTSAVWAPGESRDGAGGP